MPDNDELTAARKKVLDWGPDFRRPSAMNRFRDDVRELERLAVGIDVGMPGGSGTIVVMDPDGRVWTPEEVGEALGAVTAATKRDRPIRPLPTPLHEGPLASYEGGPWTCSACGWTEGDEPREHDKERANA